MGGRSVVQRQAIKLAYETMYARDLVKDLKSDLSGNCRDLVVAMMMPRAHYDAFTVHRAVAGLGTEDGVLILALCS